MKIGIFGGSFDPIHNEHINMALASKQELGLDRLYIVPAKVSPFKKTLKVTSPNARLEMIKLAFQDTDAIVSDYELTKQGDSYTYETVLQFKKFFPKDTLYLIIGGDSLVKFKDWKNPDIITKNAEIVVVERSGDYISYEAEAKSFKKRFGKNFIKLNHVGGTVSATKVRLYSSLRLPLDGLVPKAVEEYIYKNGIFEGNPYLSYLQDVMTPDRMRHTANVVTTAIKKANQEGMNTDKVIIASILHDVAKNIDPDTVEGFTYKGIPKQVVHAYLGAHVMETRLGITDRDILDAVRYHTTAKAPMTKLGKLIFSADMVEESRNYDGVERLREIFYTKDLDTAFVECLSEEIKHLEQKGYELFVETRNAYDYYIKNKNRIKR